MGVTIYRPVPLDGYELVQPLDPADYETIIRALNGKAHAEKWRPLQVSLIRSDRGEPWLPSDSPWLGGHALVFRPRAVEALGDILRDHGELLPLDCRDADLAVLNVTRVVDALDQAASSVERFPDGRVWMIRHHVFRADAVRGLELFKIPNLRVSATYVGDGLVDRWRSAGLSGLGFQRLWSEEGPAQPE